MLKLYKSELYSLYGFNKLEKVAKKCLTLARLWCIIDFVEKSGTNSKRKTLERVVNRKRVKTRINGSLAQLGEHLPYKQRVIGSSPITSIFGRVVQLVRTPACHAGGRGFEPHSGRLWELFPALCLCSSVGRAGD